ncbi:uncharacterized protein LOC115601015 [Strigops habroptila]|uniref:uncharacterized protein LOC115601015 n=1 Tax=Strigops habroptila TaxID=2489341 RepID=UPI0011CFD5D4|nr:uncharacterized protein LOC115601015 [Strigops habroptila]
MAGIYKRPANLQTGQSVIMKGFTKLKGMGQLAIYTFYSVYVGAGTPSRTQRMAQSSSRRTANSLEEFLPRSFTLPPGKTSLERNEICLTLHRDLLSSPIMHDCFVVDHGNVEGTYSKNESEIMYESTLCYSNLIHVTTRGSDKGCALIASVDWENKLWWESAFQTLDVGRKAKDSYETFPTHRIKRHLLQATSSTVVQNKATFNLFT